MLPTVDAPPWIIFLEFNILKFNNFFFFLGGGGFRKMNIFGGMKILCIFFLGGGEGVITKFMHFRVFS